MNICDGSDHGTKSKHPEVVYEDRECPLCELISKAQDAEGSFSGYVEDLESIIKELDRRIEATQLLTPTASEETLDYVMVPFPIKALKGLRERIDDIKCQLDDTNFSDLD